MHTILVVGLLQNAPDILVAKDIIGFCQGLFVARDGCVLQSSLKIAVGIVHEILIVESLISAGLGMVKSPYYRF